MTDDRRGRRSRRAYLRSLGGLAGAGVAAGLAGCGGLFETQSVSEPPLVGDRPGAVYVPTHTEGMHIAGMASAGRLRFALTYSFAHRFWLIEGETLTKVPVESEDDAHLMVSVWDAETGMTIPASEPTLSVTKDGESVLSGLSLWRMLSQTMGVHFGDNVSLAGDGTYEVTVDYGPVGTRKTGVFREAFDEQVTAEFTVEFSQDTLEDLPYEDLGYRQGEEGAVEPMQMEMMPVPQLRPADAMPGRLGAQGSSGDATLLARVLEERPEGVDGSGPYLYVSPRTPHNRYPLPNMSIDATLAGDGGTTFDGALTATLSPTLDYHYGAAVDAAAAGDTLSIDPLLPPQLSRHEGYETAMLDMPPVEVPLESR